MLKTQGFIIACLALLLGITIGSFLSNVLTRSTPPQAPVEEVKRAIDPQAVRTALETVLTGRGIESSSLTPFLLMEQFGATRKEDFNQTQAIGGIYVVEDLELVYQGEAAEALAAADLTEEGFAKFVKNFAERSALTDTRAVIDALVLDSATEEQTPYEDENESNNEFVACTMDAKLCPDGSYVGRVAPDCAFAECPVVAEPTTILCTPEEKKAEVCAEIYQPVCASVQIQCVTTPCEPIPKTFGNSCEACSQHSVTSYTEGECTTL